jgi:hypothetical protein
MTSGAYAEYAILSAIHVVYENGTARFYKHIDGSSEKVDRTIFFNKNIVIVTLWCFNLSAVFNRLIFLQ